MQRAWRVGLSVIKPFALQSPRYTVLYEEVLGAGVATSVTRWIPSEITTGPVLSLHASSGNECSSTSTSNRPWLFAGMHTVLTVIVAVRASAAGAGGGVGAWPGAEDPAGGGGVGVGAWPEAEEAAGGGGAERMFVIVQIAESPALTVIDPSAAQSPPITRV